MPSEDWIQHSIVARVLYDWQTLIAGLLAVLAAWRTIWATTKSADREVAAFQPVGVFSKGAFPELRAVCVRCGGLITRDLLELERDLDIFASQSQGEPGGLGELLRTRVHEQLGAIEFRATRLQREAVAAMERANAVIAEPEEPVSAPEPKRRSLLRYWFGWRAA
jgi:hypothetical protein